MNIGLRDANQNFSRIVKAIRAGEEVTLTDRGKPMARISPIRAAPDSRQAMRALERAGLLRGARAAGPMPRWTPRTLKGGPISQTLREERDRR
jgi:prevent-host-death family protein